MGADKRQNRIRNSETKRQDSQKMKQGGIMFTVKELKCNRVYIERKKNDILESKGGSDWNYIQTLQTLITLGAVVDEKLQKELKIEGGD